MLPSSACFRRKGWSVVGGVLLAIVASVLPVHRWSRPPVSATPAEAAPGPLLITVDARTGHAFIGFPYDTTGRPVLVLDTATGRFLHPIPLPPASYFTALAVDPRTAHLFIAYHGTSATAAVHLVDARTGALLRNVPVDPEPDSIAVDVQHGHVFVASSGYSHCSITGRCLDTGTNGVYDTTIRVLAATTGQPLRTLVIHETPSTGSTVAVDGRTNHIVVLSAATSDKKLSVLDAVSGRVIRATPLPDTADQAPLINAAAQRAYVLTTLTGSRPSQVYLFDTRTGARVGLVHLDSAALASATDATAHPGAPHGYLVVTTLGPTKRVRAFPNDPRSTLTVVVPTGRGKLDVFDGRGRLVHTLSVGVGPSALVVDQHSGRVLVANASGLGPRGQFTASGSLSIIDEQSGQLLHTVRLGAPPIALAVNPRNGHAVVVSYDPLSGISRVSIIDENRGAVLHMEPLVS